MAFVNGICNPIQQKLNDVAGSNAPSLKRDKVGYLMALVSPENTAGIESIQVDTRNGKDNRVEITYYQRGLESQVATSCDDDCATGDEFDPFAETVTVDNCLQKPLNFDEDEMAKLCEGEAEWTAGIINAQMNAILVKLNKELLTLQAANLGNFIDGTSVSHQLQLFNDIATNAQTAKVTALAKIEDDMEEAGFSAQPIVVGSGDLSIWAKSLGLDPMSSFSGVEANLGNDASYYKDRFLDGIIDVPQTGSFLAMAPGQVQLLTYNKYVGARAKSGATFEHGTIVDPLTGLTFDLKSHYDDCADKWNIKVQLRWDLHFTPADAFAATDDNLGINGTFLYHSCQAFQNC